MRVLVKQRMISITNLARSHIIMRGVVLEITRTVVSRQFNRMIIHYLEKVYMQQRQLETLFTIFRDLALAVLIMTILRWYNITSPQRINWSANSSLVIRTSLWLPAFLGTPHIRITSSFKSTPNPSRPYPGTPVSSLPLISTTRANPSRLSILSMSSNNTVTLIRRPCFSKKSIITLQLKTTN